MKLENQNIIIVSNEPWGNTWYSKHNYAWELAKHNKVIFLNPAQKWKFRFSQKQITSKKITDNLTILSYHNSIPSLNKFCFKINNTIVSKRINKYLRKNNFTNFIFWTFDLYRLYNPKLIGCTKSILHAVDKHQFVHWGEKLICQNVDQFILVSNEIQSLFAAFPQPKLIVGHAISLEEFQYNERPKDIPKENYALYVGNIDLRLDYYQIEQIVMDHPNLNFVFLGNKFFDQTNECANRLFIQNKYKNVIAPGAKNFKDLKHYIGHSTFCFALMIDSFNGNRIAHHKIFQYLALGKPVFSSVFTDYLPVNHLLYMEDNLPDLKYKINLFLEKGESDELKNQRIAYAKEHTFENAFIKIGNFLT